MSEDVVNIQLQESFSVTASVVRETFTITTRLRSNYREVCWRWTRPSAGCGGGRQAGCRWSERRGSDSPPPAPPERPYRRCSAVHYYRPYRANSLLTTGGQLLGGNPPPLPPCALKLANFQWFTISFCALRL